MFRSFALLAAALALWTVPAAAVVLNTPMLPVDANRVVTCDLTNTGPKPITAKVGVNKFDGTAATSFADNCNQQPLAPGKTCGWQADTGVSGFCSFDVSSSKVRAAGYIVDITNIAVPHVEQIVPAAK